MYVWWGFTVVSLRYQGRLILCYSVAPAESPLGDRRSLICPMTRAARVILESCNALHRPQRSRDTRGIVFPRLDGIRSNQTECLAQTHDGETGVSGY